MIASAIAGFLCRAHPGRSRPGKTRRSSTLHRRVAEVLPTRGLFWAVSDTGDRRLIEFKECNIQTLGTHSW
jgi:hypothetical protein